MAHNYGATPDTTDEYGRPVRHGNPAHTNGSPGAATNPGGEYGTHEEKKGGIKDKLPGSKDDLFSHDTSANTNKPFGGGGGGTAYTEDRGVHQQQENKGIFGNIKERLPGTKDDQCSHDTSANTNKPYGGGGAAACTEDRGLHQQQQEKKGIIGDIKEKLPGNKKDDQYSHDTSANTNKPYGGGGGPACTPEEEGEHHKKTQGMMGQIKEKLPVGSTTNTAAGHKDDPFSHDDKSANKPYGGGAACTEGGGGEHPRREEEKKGGMVGNIKEKLPGGGGTAAGHNADHKPAAANTTKPHGGTAAYTKEGEHTQQEKKGMMDKIKEKLPGGPK